MKKHYEIKDPKAPATKGQLFYLHILTGEDTRGWTLTKGEAAKQIATKLKNGKATPAPADEQLPEKPTQDGSIAVKNHKTPAKTPSKATERAKKAPQKASPPKDKGKAKKQGKSARQSVEDAWNSGKASKPESPEVATARRLGATVI